MSPRWRPRLALWMSAVALLLVAGGWAILLLPLSTFQGVNYRVTAYRIPAYVKAIDFVHRHYQYQLLVHTICEGKQSDIECVMAIFDWTHRTIPPTPQGWPVVDDHPLHIVIRGHGKSDQIADVFAVLCGYAGVPAFFKRIENPRRDGLLVLVFVHLGGKWVPFDVERDVVFRNRRGELAGVDELIADQELVDAQTAGLLPGGVPYSAFISRQTLVPFVVPHPTRAEMQQPWPRLQHELRRVVGWERE
jgi:hypothetical protein